MSSKMSTSNENNNGKRSSNNSIVNTSSSASVTNITNGAGPQVYKYGTLVPNRIFVGGISAKTTEGELVQLFSNYGNVRAAKIIQDRTGVSRGYGFITFENEDDAKRPLREAENIVLRERKLNIAPAIKKQPFNRTFEAPSPTTVSAGNPPQFFFPPTTGMPYFQGGVAYYPPPASISPGDPSVQQSMYQPPPIYPGPIDTPQPAAYPSMMLPPQPFYMFQQYPMPLPYDYNFYQNNGPSAPTQYVAGVPSNVWGPQNNSLPPLSSPPRPPCYSQQMPSYNPGDSMFYNLPVYGGTLEGPPLYADSFELAGSEPYGEVHISPTSQNFVPQGVRRNKRTLRRNGGSGVNEIGAGDAPLPGELGDVCKKMDTLKL